MPLIAPDAIFYANEASRWRAVQSRDAAADGAFVYAVRTTGIYRNPSSASRLPKREDVEFFDDAASAQAAGYRPTYQRDRTKLHTEQTTAIAQACRSIEAAASPMPLTALATQAGMSAFHFHRLFKAETGLTPKAYASAHRARKMREALQDNKTSTTSVTDAIYEAGFQSSSRFYETAEQRLGMPPRNYRDGGTGAVIHFAVGECSLGAILVAQSARGVCAIALGDDPNVLVRELQDQFPKSQLLGGDTAFEQCVAHVVGYVESPAKGLHLPLDIRGTAFQERVWQALRHIPLGETVSYTDIAQRIGAPTAVRAVAQACGANRIAIAIPCHRVVRMNGDLSGYRWGIERKRELLLREIESVKP